MDEKLNQRVNAVARIAVAIERDTGLPAQVLIAQWAIESRWGAKPTGAANYFGIKKAARHEKCCTVLTREVINGKSIMQRLEFADYGSIEDSCRDYAWLIVTRYKVNTEFQNAAFPILAKAIVETIRARIMMGAPNSRFRRA
jgi:flagellum-specific peptidoglycan hydrolase FlgJ